MGFTTWRFLGSFRARSRRAEPSWTKGSFWSGVAGYTSFVAHAGGPPLNVYLLPQELDKTRYVGTTIVFFALVNYVKLVPYGILGQFDSTNLVTSAVLTPLAPIGVLLGVFLHQRVSQALIFQVVYAGLLVTGVKLLWDGSEMFR